jgi:hypothetical protein
MVEKAENDRKLREIEESGKRQVIIKIEIKRLNKFLLTDKIFYTEKLWKSIKELLIAT